VDLELGEKEIDFRNFFDKDDMKTLEWFRRSERKAPQNRDFAHPGRSHQSDGSKTELSPDCNPHWIELSNPRVTGYIGGHV
jgi:hypothetical protein